MSINKSIKQLSNEGLLSILNSKDWICLDENTTRIEGEQILQLNIDNGLIDEIEILIVLEGE